MLILACAALALQTGGDTDRPSLEDALAEAHVVVTGAVVAERELRLDAHRREPVLEIRVETWHYGRDPKDAVFLRAAGAGGEPPRIGGRALFLLDERTAYRHDAGDGEPRLRTRDGVHEVGLHERVESAKDREADAHLRRLFDVLPIDPAVWSEP